MESVRDPGNLGTVIRTCLAFGVDEIILSDDCADIYNEKTVRASMGCLFSQKITVTENIPDTIKTLQKEGYTVYSAALENNSVKLDEVEVTAKTCFVIGNEGHGLSKETIDATDSALIIPMPGGAESLNASVASTILIWEMYKGRNK